MGDTIHHRTLFSLASMRRLYSFLFYLVMPFVLLRLYKKGQQIPAYRERIKERLSLHKPAPRIVDIWIHAASLGEVISITPLIEELIARSYPLLITTMTTTGSAYVVTQFGDRVLHQYIPYDLPWVVRRFFKRIKPRLGLIIETELWPNIIHGAKKNGMHLVLGNARISDKAFSQYKIIRRFIRPAVRQFDAILPQSLENASRFIALGAEPSHITLLGNLKFDRRRPTIADTRLLHWDATRVVLLLASTHPGEEQQILSRLSNLQKSIPSLLLLLAPRHPERFQMVYALSQDLGYKTALRSKASVIHADTAVVVIDSLGELLSFYQVSDYAFVGGSLVPIGGHNVLEPIAMGIPVFCGSFTNNFKAIVEELQDAEAITVVKDADELVARILTMQQNSVLRESQVRNATQVFNNNQGCVARYLHYIDDILGKAE